MSVRLSLVDLRDPNTLVQVLQEALRFVPQVHWFPTVFPVADAPVSIYHNLGEIPQGMISDALVSVSLAWASADDRQEWDRNRVVVRCNTSGATIRIGLIV